ncbi:MAG TPA: hypothetical protein VEU96_00365 [Bryobacteraceae bacterium]|nr:hypothetical protein [Bryobacteraceae bacterium]
MPLPVPTTIATGFNDLLGSSYRLSTDQLYVADAGSPGSISAVNAHTHAKTVLGTGYNSPSDVELSVDGLHAYVAEHPGALLRLSLTNMNRAAATVVASGLNGIQQIALDEPHGVAYVAEFTGGHIQRINLSTGAKTVVATIAFPRGVLVTGDGRFLYVSGDTDTITRFDLSTNTSVVIASGINTPRYLTWADAGESVILFPQTNPTGSVLKADLTASPVTITAIAGPTSPAPYSVAVLSSNQLLIASASAVSEVDLTASVYSAAGPIFLGIGFVPADLAHLPNGYADTTGDPSYFFQVKDCPFGGTLPLMINWQHARSPGVGANFYQVFIDGEQVTQPFSDYLWSPSTTPPEFELQTTVPASGGYYPLRSAGQIWLNFWLGLLLDTSGKNGLHTISIKLFSATSVGSEIGHSTDPGRFVKVMLDNTEPVANILQILQQPGNHPVNTCAIVNTGTPTFTFQVTASAPNAHLLGWSLTAYWGDNKSMSVASDSYNNHISATRLWAGITAVAVPPPGPTPWNAKVTAPVLDPTSIHCAHTFWLSAWDRVINGWDTYTAPPAITSPSRCCFSR